MNIKGPSIFFNPLCGIASPALSQQQGRPCLAPGCAHRRAAAMGSLPRAREPSHTHGGLKPGAALVGARLSQATGGAELAATTALRHATSRPAFLFWCASPRAGPAAPAGPRSSRRRPLPSSSTPFPLSAKTKAEGRGANTDTQLQKTTGPVALLLKIYFAPRWPMTCEPGILHPTYRTSIPSQ